MNRELLASKFLRRPEMVALIAGGVIFIAGLATFIAARTTDPDTPSSVPLGADQAQLGPPGGAELGPYMSSKTATLEARAKSEPKGVSLAVVSFDDYRRPSEVVKLIGGDTTIIRVFCRIPVAGSAPEELRVDKASFAPEVAKLAASRRSTLSEELLELRKLIPTVDDPAYRAVYKQDAEAIKKMLTLLTEDPPIVYGVVIKLEHRSLVGLSKAPGVKLVDIPGSEGPAPSRFTAILPEQTQRTDPVV